jgi:hypothetical protein
MKSNLQLELEIEAFALYYQDKIKSSEALLSFAGIICHLDGDVLLLKDIYDHFFILSEQIEQMKNIVKKNNARMLEMESENEKLTKLLTNYKSWE